MTPPSLFLPLKTTDFFTRHAFFMNGSYVRVQILFVMYTNEPKDETCMASNRYY